MQANVSKIRAVPALCATTVMIVSVALPSASGASRPFATAASARHIYWTDPETSRGSGGPGIDTIGRASIDGSHVEQSFILAGEKVEDGEGSPMGLAIGP